MKQEIDITKELEKLKKDSQYIDVFCNMVRQKLGDNQERFNQIINEAIAYYKKVEEMEVYIKLVSLKLEYDLIYGMLNQAIEMGEEVLNFFESRALDNGVVIASEKLMLAYMNKGLLKKAEFYRVKATTTLKRMQEANQIQELQEVVGLKQIQTIHTEEIDTEKISIEAVNAEDVDIEEVSTKESNTEEAKTKEIHIEKQKATNSLESNNITKNLQGIQNQKLHIRLTLSTIRFYMLIKEYKRAQELLLYIKQIKTSLTPEEIQEGLALCLELDLQKNEIEKAIEYVQEAQSLLGEEEASQKYVFTNVIRLRGILNGKRSLHMQAEKDFKLAIKLCKHYKEIQVRTLISWAEYLMDQEKNDEAYEKITSAIKLAGKIDSPYFFVEAYERLGYIYENKKQWELAYKAINQLNQYKSQMESVQIGQASYQGIALEPMKEYKQGYTQLEQVARLGKVLTSQLTIETLPEVIHKEIATLIDIDMIGIAVIEKGKLDYSMYELSGKWLSSDNDLMKYTMRLADHCTQFQADIIVNDGNFEEYTIKNIINSETDMKLQSMIVFVLKVENQVLGAMVLGSYKAKAYSQKDIAVARILASYLGLVLKNTRLYQKIHFLSEHDALTGLLTRHVAVRKGEKLFKENHKKHKSTGIIMLNMDLFKQINTKYGQELGNNILGEIGKIIRENVPEHDYVGRYSGEEFIVILNDLSYKEVIKVAEGIKKSIEELTFETKKKSQIKVTVSGGIYICNEYTLNFDDAIRFADHALYRAKLLGRNRIMSYSLTDMK